MSSRKLFRTGFFKKRHSFWGLKAPKSIYHLKVAIFDEKMAVVKSENLVTLHLYDLTQPSDKEILGGRQILDPLLIYGTPKSSVVYPVKSPVLGLQRAFFQKN